MTPRSLFTIILKIIGLFLIKEFLVSLASLVSIGFSFAYRYDDLAGGGIWVILASLLVVFAYGFIAHYLIFRTEYVLDKLKLADGFDQDEFPLNIHRSTILSIAVIVIGGYMVASEIPNFCRQILLYFQQRRMAYGVDDPSLSYVILSGVQIVVGLFLMAGQRHVVNLIERQRKK